MSKPASGTKSWPLVILMMQAAYPMRGVPFPATIRARANRVLTKCEHARRERANIKSRIFIIIEIFFYATFINKKVNNNSVQPK